jgi:hypothetical protein
MVNPTILLLALTLPVSQLNLVRSANQTTVSVEPQDSTKTETTYDAEKDKTIIRLAPLQISGENGKYLSLRMSPSFSFPGRQLVTPSITVLHGPRTERRAREGASAKGSLSCSR